MVLCKPMIFFTSDHHFGHKKIIEYSNRPFASVEEMDECMIQAWNAKVKPEDTVYHLGDVGLTSVPKLKSILNRLHGEIFLIRGNHETTAEDCKSRFGWIRDYFELVVDDPDAFQGKRLLILFHYAMRVWNVSHHGSWHLYGHSHGSLPDDPTSLSFDIGVDCHQFAPLSYPEVKQIMNQKHWKSPFADSKPRNL